MDLFSSIYEDMLVETTAEEILPTQLLASTEESDEEDMAVVENLVQVAPAELSKGPVDSFVQEPETVMSAEELESDEEDMAAVEELVQIIFNESESVEESKSIEGPDSDDELAAVEDMIQVELEEPVDVQSSVSTEDPTAAESNPTEASTPVKDIFATVKPAPAPNEEPVLAEEPVSPKIFALAGSFTDLVFA